ncbi:MAG TPA: carboxypeptidase regulatory-like domain-containing protein, partial [Bacteroidales bacterium]|nr:carboxypeptidase regulatory-like domain-containing protein [Bacteroidales bacterium]
PQIQLSYVSTDPPNCAILPTPANGSADVATETLLSWSSGGGSPTGYKLFLGTDNPPTNMVNGTDLGLVTTYDPVLDYLTTYYWQVIPYNTYGDATGCVTWTFTTMADPTITTFPYVESFDGTDFPPTGWTNIKTGGSGTGLWNRVTSGSSPSCSPYSGAAMARFNCYSYSTGTMGELITPPFNFPGTDYHVSFWMYRDGGYSTNADKVNVYFSSNPTSAGGTPLGTINRSMSLDPVVPAAGWYNYTFDLPSGSKEITGYFIFEGVSGYGNNIFIDHVTIEQKPTTGVLAGVVTDGTSNPLQDVLITTEPASSSVFTNASGEYEFEIPVGTYMVTFSLEGYFENIFETVVISGGQTTTLDAVMEELPGSKCENAITVEAFPYEALNQTNCGYGNFCEETCLGYYDNGDDIFYTFTLASEKIVTITIDPKETTYAGILLASECPPIECIDYKTNGYASTPMEIVQRLLPGTYYIMIDTWPSPYCIPDFDLFINAEDPPPPGTISGVVTYENGYKFPNVMVILSGGAKEVTFTNAQGAYLFEDVEAGFYEVSFSAPNYFDQVFTDVEVFSNENTILNTVMMLIPPPTCATLVSPQNNATGVLPNASLNWINEGPNPPLGYKIQLMNTTTGEWIEGDEFTATDLGNVTTYSPAEPFEWGCLYAWLITPYNFAGETTGCEPWFFNVAYGGTISGVVTDAESGLPIENVAVEIDQTLPNTYSTTVFTNENGEYEFVWENGNYNLNFSKFGYLPASSANVPINFNQTSVRNASLQPEDTYPIPFSEDWSAGTFAAQQWSVMPPADNWFVGNLGNPAPAATFYWDPRITNYATGLYSPIIDGSGHGKIYAQFDILLNNYSSATLETMSFVIYNGSQWTILETFTNFDDDIPWTTCSYDISDYSAGNIFLIGFFAYGTDTYNINWWQVDNIYISTELMDVNPPAIYDALSVGESSTWEIEINNPGLHDLTWEASLNLPVPWAVLGAVNGSIPAGDIGTITGVFDASVVTPGVYESEILFTGAGGIVQDVVLIKLEVYDQPFQKIPLPNPENWGYVSTYMNMDAKAPLETLLEPIIDEMVIMLGMEGIFWPGQQINTLGSWDTYDGYKIKMGLTGLLTFTGVPVEDKTATFDAGTHIVPVLSETSVAAADIFAEHDIEFAFGLDGSIYWPFGSIYTLETLDPGYGYLVKFNETTTLDFNVAKSSSGNNQIATFENKTPWNDVTKTGDVHIVGISEEAAAQLLTGDVIGVFGNDGRCNGMAAYSGQNLPFAVVVYGNDITTLTKDGMNDGEPMTFMLYRNGEITELDPLFNKQVANFDGLYASNGLSLITDLKLGATSITDTPDQSINLYPNPSNGLFNISGIDDTFEVFVMNAQGQVVFTGHPTNGKIDLTKQTKGVYFIKLTNSNRTITRKVVIQ